EHNPTLISAKRYPVHLDPASYLGQFMHDRTSVRDRIQKGGHPAEIHPVIFLGTEALAGALLKVQVAHGPDADEHHLDELAHLVRSEQRSRTLTKLARCRIDLALKKRTRLLDIDHKTIGGISPIINGHLAGR